METPVDLPIWSFWILENWEFMFHSVDKLGKFNSTLVEWALFFLFNDDWIFIKLTLSTERGVKRNRYLKVKCRESYCLQNMRETGIFLVSNLFQPILWYFTVTTNTYLESFFTFPYFLFSYSTKLHMKFQTMELTREWSKLTVEFSNET